MAPANSSSRLGLKIADYDQVIALSQANINDTLIYHYDTHPELCKFETKLQTATKESIRGTIKPPKIELIDIENADQAFYCLEFNTGDYSYWKQVAVQNPDPDVPPGNTWQQVKIPLKGWKLAFYVDFAMKKMAQVPEDIQKQIQLPGSYSVEQLLINFGTADTMNFNWDKSVVTGFGTAAETQNAKDVISLFVTKWLNNIKSTPGNHNTLGYAVKVDKDAAASLPSSNASFPPTAVRLQTINHRPDGDASKSSTTNDYNAFLFTEMTGTDGPTRMPAKDLAWTGDFFYDAMGGTMVMSRRIFWNLFVKEKLRPVNKRAMEGINRTAARCATPELETHSQWWLSDQNNVNEAYWMTTDGLSEIYNWKSNKYFDVEHEVPGPNHMYEYWTDTSVYHKLTPVKGTEKITLDYNYTFKSTLKLGVWGILKSLSCFQVDITATVSDTLTISLQAVDRTGGLSVNCTGGGKEPSVDINARFEGAASKIAGSIPGVIDLFNDMAKVNDLKNAIRNMMKDGVANAASTATDLQNALSGQKRFVFPGGGTFDMKSPLFNNAGDLLIGLSYRQGDAAKT